jgi:1-acyl-sn-glycerol-3-phosphate acyltransferase
MSALANVGGAARWCVRRILRLYYPRIEVEGRERLPSNGAVLFVANHPNSLLDPALIGFVVQRPVHFFAKAPLFDVPVFGALMRALGMVPAFRGQDDKAQVRKNLETLDVGAQYLKRGEAVGIFPEGKSHDREGVEQVRSGAARIAWQAVQAGATTWIVPLGLNYERKERFGSAIWVRVGEPLEATAWCRARGEEDRKAIRSLTEEIDLRLKQVVVHLNEERWQPFLNELEALLPPDEEDEQNPIAALHQRKRFADAMNFFLATDRPRAEGMAATIENHRAQLASCGLTMDSSVLNFGLARLTWRLLRKTFWLLVEFVPAVAGALHHLLPFAITRGIVQLVKHPGRKTTAQNRLMIGLPIYAIWYAVVWWWLAKHTSAWLAWLWIAAMPFAGIVALHYAWRMRHAGRAWWHELKMLARPKELRRLRFAQVELRRRLQHWRTEFRAKAG